MYSSSKSRQPNNSQFPCDEINLAIHENLMALRFDLFCKKSSNAFPPAFFTKDMFMKANQKGFEAVIFFLLKMIHGESIRLNYRSCYPCLDREQQSEFRKNTISLLKELEKKSSTLKFAQIYVHQYCGDNFCTYLLNLTNYVLGKFIQNQSVKIDMDSSSFCLEQALNDEIIRSEKFSSCLTSLESKQTRTEYLRERQAFLMEQHNDIDSETESFIDRAREFVPDGSDNIEEVLKIDVLNKKAEISLKENQICMLASKTHEKIRELWNKLDNITSKQDSQNINMLELVSLQELPEFKSGELLDLDKIRTRAMLISCSFKKQCEMWTNLEECDSLITRFCTIKEEIERSLTYTSKGLENLEAAKNEMHENTIAEKTELLLDPRITRKRKNISCRLSPLLGHLSKMKVNFGATRCFRSRPSSMLFDPLLTSPNAVSPDGHYRKSNLSFHPADISVFTYVAPSAPEGYVLSPLREEC
ncbi:dim gamma-tubulin 6 [Brevipalpus obovatus]|uniref:dim gamma-tubulin 6 n=1 Tax=Brevipalpus obovatus TaxID=246614 RepID=UPI003D9E0C1F